MKVIERDNVLCCVAFSKPLNQISLIAVFVKLR